MQGWLHELQLRPINILGAPQRSACINDWRRMEPGTKPSSNVDDKVRKQKVVCCRSSLGL